ncbi:MAG TPA: sigma-70 family RNA polymerase sigma factor [candidate division Zixibacteria bacterium]|nr:sigma-70 family RNA polymerase sigma factor [candidate division Zixibacteria bacterium]
MDERELVQKAQAGDFTAFMQLVDAHKGKVYGLARKLAGSEEDAEDIVQDTLLKAIDKIDQFRGDASFGTWLYSIALNEARRLYARSQRMELQPVDEYLPSSRKEDHNSFEMFDWRDPHQLLEDAEIRRLVDEALAELPYKYREVFLLRYVEELSVKEVAELTGQSVASAKSRILRARLAMRDYLSKAFEVEYDKRLS